MTKRRDSALVFAACALATVPMTWASHASADDFYHGKTLTIIVGFSPGGGFDANARLLARYIGKHIPGHPKVVVQNMPGAASLTSVRYLDATAPKDGSVIDTFNFGQITQSKLEPKKIRVDFRKYNWIGSITTDISACYAWGKLGVRTLAQMKAHGVMHMGTTSVGASSDISQRILKHIFGVNVQQVTGYPGSAEERLAIERGELDGDCGAWSSLPPKWIDDKLIDPVLRFSPILGEGMPKSAPFAENIAPTARARKIINLLTASGGVGRPFIASAAVPANRIKILRAAFDATMRDPKFLADAKRERLPVYPKNAKEAIATVDGIYDAPGDIVRAAHKIATQ